MSWSITAIACSTLRSHCSTRFDNRLMSLFCFDLRLPALTETAAANSLTARVCWLRVLDATGPSLFAFFDRVRLATGCVLFDFDDVVGTG